jgi:hypothetical protein
MQLGGYRAPFKANGEAPTWLNQPAALLARASKADFAAHRIEADRHPGIGRVDHQAWADEDPDMLWVPKTYATRRYS